MTAPAPTPKPCILYRLHDADGTLLYVGITDNWPTRMGQHARHQPWWRDVADIRLEQHHERALAENAERDAIRAERPLHNIVHNAGRAITPASPDQELAVGLVGHFFLTPDAEHGFPLADRQGHVVALVGDSTYLVEWFEWGWGAPNGRQLIALHEMAPWRFFADQEQFLDAGERAMASRDRLDDPSVRVERRVREAREDRAQRDGDPWP